MCMPSEKKTNNVKYKYLFKAVQKLIHEFDPLGLLVAPIDEYDDLCHNVLSILLKNDDSSKKQAELERIITESSSMEFKTTNELNGVVDKLLEIDIYNTTP